MIGPHLARRSGGFTLIEVLVAVVVLALALTAVISAGSSYARQAADQRERTLALWVAHNRIAEVQVQPAWPAVGKSNGDVTMGGVRWRWLEEVKDTTDEHLRRIDIRIVKQDKPDDKYSYAMLSTFISNAGRNTSQ